MASDTKYPDEIRIDVDARIHLEHTDVEEYSMEEVEGVIVSRPNEGEYSVTLEPNSGRAFQAFTGWICVAIIIIVLLDWPKPANEEEEEKRKRRELPQPQNFLDLSDGEYTGRMTVDFDDGYAFKEFEMSRTGEEQFEANVESIHRYPRSKSEEITKLLPHDVVFVDGGPGSVFGRTQVRFLREDGSIVTGDGEIEIQFENQYARLQTTEVFSYEYESADLDRTPAEIEARGVMRAVDTGPRQTHLPRRGE